MTAARDRRHVVVTGRVQGVGYRAWLEDKARAAGLDGWVRNRRDGTVEAVLAGPPTAVADMVNACRQGPPLARPKQIDERSTEEEPGPGFRTRATV